MYWPFQDALGLKSCATAMTILRLAISELSAHERRLGPDIFGLRCCWTLRNTSLPAETVKHVRRLARRPVGFLQPLPPTGRPFQQVGMDFLGPFRKSRSGNRYILVMTDYHSKWVEAVALPTASASDAARGFVENVVLWHGAPDKLLTDRGRHFVASLIEDIFKLMQTNHATTTAYHPQTNGLCERFNRTLADMISMYVSSNHSDWDEFLPYLLFDYNSSHHDTMGYTPFFLLHGHEPNLPVGISLKLVRQED